MRRAAHYDEGPSFPHVTVLLRASTLARRSHVDALLAAGGDVVSSPALAIRARQLTSLRTRRRVARWVDAVMDQQAHPLGAAVPVAVGSVRAAGEDLAAARDRLTAPVPVYARGVALLMLLLRDGSGPLYRDGDAGRARADARRALRALTGSEDRGLT